MQDRAMGVEIGRETTMDLGAVYLEHGERLWRALLLATGDAEVANDAVAEAFAQAIRRGAGIVDPVAWVWRAAFRIAAGEMKERRRMLPLEDQLPVETPELLFDLFAALRELTPHQRASIVLADYAGYRHREIARILGSSVGAVGVHVHRARRRMRELLEDDDD